MLKIKLFAVFAFLSGVTGVYLISGGGALAQTSKSDENREEILKSVAGYKQWKRVQKPEPDLSVLKSDVVPIFNSSVAG
jgi:hypothetical protein